MTTLLIARHGNTFEKDQEPVRIGCKTDLPLSNSGIIQAENIGHYINTNKIVLNAVYCGTLKRTQETATLALEAANISLPINTLAMFDEIDYGPDEGKTNDQILARIGDIALRDWENMAIAPPGWLVDTDKIVQNWHNFATEIINKYPAPNATILVITSNGIARFAPYLTNDFFHFIQHHNIKLATGTFGSLTFKDSGWKADYWNQEPQ